MITTTIGQLQERILAAHERGDTRELARLQALYRSQALMSSAGRGYSLSPVRVIGVSAPGRPAALAPPARASAAQGPTISLAPHALAELRSLDFDYYEDHGWLIGPRATNGAEVTDAIGRTDMEHRGRTWVRPDLEQAAAIQRGLEPDEQITGDFHTHPAGNGQPSTADRVACEEPMNLMGRSQWISLIVRDAPGAGVGDIRISGELSRRENGRIVHRSVEVSTWSYR